MLDKKHRIQRFDGSKKELLTLMSDQAGKIEKFISIKKLSLQKKAHLKVIFSYYNTLQVMQEKNVKKDGPLTSFQPMQ